MSFWSRWTKSGLVAAPAKVPASIVAVDVETTGLYADDRIVTLGAWRIDGMSLTNNSLDAECLHIIVDPGKKSHPKAEELHGYSDWTLRHQQPFSEFAPQVRDFLSSAEALVAHNASFDLEFIEREYRLLGQPALAAKSFCTMNAYRQRQLPGRATLNAASQTIGLSRSGKRHGALEDAWLALMVYLWLNDASSRHILPFNQITDKRIPLVPSNFREPAPLPIGPVPSRRQAAKAKVRELTARRREAKEMLTKAVRPTILLLLEVARAGDSLVSEEIEILVDLVGATRDRLQLEADSESEFDLLAELFDVELSQNQLTRSARTLCNDDIARSEFPRWLAAIATVDGEISNLEREAVDRVKAAIERILPSA